MKKIAPFILVGSLSFTFNVTADTHEHYEKALSAFNKTQYDEAVIHLKNSLREDEENLSSKILLGQILVATGYYYNAELEFFEALGLGADINLVIEPLSKALLFQNKYQDVITLENVNRLSAENSLKWLLYKATAHTRLKEFDEAIATHQQILKKSPQNLASLNGLAAIFIFKEEYQNALPYLDKADEVSSQNAMGFRLRGQIALSQGDKEAALRLYEQAYALEPKDPRTLRAIADLYLSMEKFSDAEVFVEELMASTPNDPLAILLSSWLGSKDKDKLIPSENLNKLNSIVSSLTPEELAAQPELLYISGLTAFLFGNTERAESLFNRYLSFNPDDLQAIILLARTYLLSQQTKQALILLEKHETKLLDDLNSALLLGELYINQNRAFKAETLVKRLNIKYPDNSALRFFQIKLSAALGRIDESLNLLQQNWESNKENPQFLLTYSMLNLQNGKLDAAFDGASKLIELVPDSAEFTNLAGGIKVQQGELDEAKHYIDKALEISPTLFAAKFNLASIYSRKGELEASNLIIAELLERAPQHRQSLFLKAFNLNILGKTDEAKAIYDELLVLYPKFTNARYQLAQVNYNNNDTTEALYHLNKLISDDFDNPDYLLLKAEWELKSGKRDEASRTLNIVKHFTTSDLRLLNRQSDLYVKAGDLTSAIETLKTAERLAPASFPIKIGLVRLLIKTNDLESAADLLNTLGQDHSENPEYWYTKALFSNASLTPQNAVKYLQKSLSLAPNYSAPLALLYNMTITGIETDFEAIAQQLVNENSNNLLAKNLLAQHFYNIREFNQSIPLYLDIVNSGKAVNQAIALNRLAIMHLEADQTKALEYASEALKLKPDTAEILDTYGWLLTLTGQQQEGLSYLRKAYTRDASDPEIRYHIAYTLAKLNRTAEAIRELEQVVDIERPFASRREASALLAELKTNG